MEENMRVLVTGGAGFIGTHLVSRLKKHKHKVSIIDKRMDKEIRWRDNYPEGKFDIIYHLAANADVKGGIDNTNIDLNYNIVGTHSILEYMNDIECKNLIFTSSATIYGERRDLPTKEEAPNLKPISLYGASKLSAEHLIEAYSHMFGINANIFRFGNIIGEGNTHGVINDFVRKLLLEPNTIEILGDGKQTKQYLYIDDCINALVDTPIKDGVNIYNLSHDDYIKVENLVKIVINEMELTSEIKFMGGDRGWIGDVPITILDNTKIKQYGWKPTVSLEDGIRRTVRWLIANK